MTLDGITLCKLNHFKNSAQLRIWRSPSVPSASYLSSPSHRTARVGLGIVASGDTKTAVTAGH